MDDREPMPGTAAQLAVALVQGALDRVGVAHDAVVPGCEAQVHRAIDLLRSVHADPALRARIEGISCLLMQMRHFHRQGRVNAYASALLRLRRAGAAL